MLFANDCLRRSPSSCLCRSKTYAHGGNNGGTIESAVNSSQFSSSESVPPRGGKANFTVDCLHNRYNAALLQALRFSFHISPMTNLSAAAPSSVEKVNRKLRPRGGFRRDGHGTSKYSMFPTPFACFLPYLSLPVPPLYHPFLRVDGT